MAVAVAVAVAIAVAVVIVVLSSQVGGQIFVNHRAATCCGQVLMVSYQKLLPQKCNHAKTQPPKKTQKQKQTK